jgi:hypothetical protein
MEDVYRVWAPVEEGDLDEAFFEAFFEGSGGGEVGDE